ncbi:MAG: prolyl oligopeptidase family serine peptidase [Planctomycetes bacterium]|nr:prolyl oligopeptidase family serine peptidase [Planctomycetota bacterium]
MSLQETFEIEVGAGVVRGTLRAPAREEAVTAVLLCGDPPGTALEHEPLLAELAERLVDAGLAAARFGAREDDPAALDRADTLVDDASAVLRWLLLHDGVDARGVGLFGCCVGATIAAGLTARTDQVSGLCMLAPVSGADAVGRIDKTNGLAALLDPGAVPPAYLASLAELAATENTARRPQPTLVMRGAADRIVTAANTQRFVDAVERASHPIQYELIAHGGHEMRSAEARRVCFARIVSFFSGLEPGAVAS